MMAKEQIIQRVPEILGGTPIFVGTRVPARVLIDCLLAGDRLDDFLDDFPTVSREQAKGLLEIVNEIILAQIDESAA